MRAGTDISPGTRSVPRPIHRSRGGTSPRSPRSSPRPAPSRCWSSSTASISTRQCRGICRNSRAVKRVTVTVRMLLNHTSGMPAYAKLWLAARTVAEARATLFAIPLRRAPGASAEYSDLNAMLAGIVVERVAGEPLDRVAQAEVFQPLGMLSTGYRPSAADKADAAPTGRFRGQPVGGVVNDRNAATLGGVSGHAGVFSTGYDLARFAQGWLRAASGSRRLAQADAPSPNSWRTLRQVEHGFWDGTLRCRRVVPRSLSTAGAPRRPPTAIPAGPERKSGSIPARTCLWYFSPTGALRRTIRRNRSCN